MRHATAALTIRLAEKGGRVTTTPMHQNWIDVRFTARDGLSLYGRHYPAPGSRRRPLVCLAGLTRNSRDFHDLASVLADPRGHRRDVYCLDYRGRGLSEHDADGKSYTVLTELGDVLDFMALKGIADAAVIGTSRGGIIAMAMAAMRPSAMGAVILNDVGPVIERDGLARIIAYVGRVPLPGTWTEAANLMRMLHERAFPAETDASWLLYARAQFNDRDGRPALGYDPKLAKALSLTDGPAPELWPQFEALRRIPMFAIRGANSDILSAATLTEMQRRHPDCQVLTVADQGHAPLLRDHPTISAIYQFLLTHDPLIALEDEPRTERPLPM
jgi:pimeloyl-ACP methyl ester carboxylesterase